ncbi:MAG: hypothetical protein HY329_13840 [Chloroflexi bacterium]|nr:hypothetical protein [Chloroflexota bacterium]
MDTTGLLFAFPAPIRTLLTGDELSQAARKAALDPTVLKDRPPFFWRAIEGFPEDRLVYQVAIMTAAIINAMPSFSKQRKAAKPTDFLPDPWGELVPRAKDWRTLMAKMEQINAELGGQDLRGQPISE